MIEHLETNNLLKDSQHGFRRKRSCLTNLLSFFDEVTDMVDQGMPVDVVYLDFQKAFDKVSHAKLLQKLRRYGIRGKTANWIEDWLCGRRQRVVVEGSKSGWERVWSGVPQGSVLGPLLFLVYVDDLDDDIWNMLLKFADDTKLISKVQTDDDRLKLQGDLDKLYKWSQEWSMDFNVEKCSIMHLGFRNGHDNFKLGPNLLREIHEEKDLGVLVTDDLKVGKQCCKAANDANRVLGMIKRNFTCKSGKIVIPLYKSLVRPRLDYCIQAWRPYLEKDIVRLEKVQRRATKLVEGCYDKPYEERLKVLGLTTLRTRMLRADMIEVYKIFNGLDDMSADRLFKLCVAGRGHSFKVYKKRFNLDMGKYKFANRICDEWNALTDDIVTARTLNSFKSKLDHHLKHVMGYT